MIEENDKPEHNDNESVDDGKETVGHHGHLLPLAHHLNVRILKEGEERGIRGMCLAKKKHMREIWEVYEDIRGGCTREKRNRRTGETTCEKKDGNRED